MPVVWDIDSRRFVPGYSHEGKTVPTKRKHWREILTEGEVVFVETTLKEKKKHMSHEESKIWEEVHKKVPREGWDGWRLVGNEVKGISRIPIDTVHQEPLELRPREPAKKGPLSGTLDGMGEFVHEE